MLMSARSPSSFSCGSGRLWKSDQGQPSVLCFVFCVCVVVGKAERVGKGGEGEGEGRGRWAATVAFPTLQIPVKNEIPEFTQDEVQTAIDNLKKRVKQVTTMESVLMIPRHATERRKK